MDTSDVEPDSGTATRRRSTRERKAVAAFSPATSATKRKRNAADDDDEENDDVDMDDASDDDDDDDDDDDESEGDPDEEEMRENKRRAAAAAAKKRKTTSSSSAKPAAKKPKKSKAQVNGTVVDLAIRPAATTAGRAPAAGASKKKRAKQDASAEEAGGLYAEIFGRGKDYDDVASEWLARFRKHEPRAIAEVFNFVMKCAGCDLQIDEHEVEDPDSFPDKLRDMQDEYQAQNVADYPIIARGRAAVSFRSSMEGFFSSLVQVLATSGLLYSSPVIMENIEVWVGVMSSAANRPFRHTATAISLCIVNELAELATEVIKSAADFSKMSEGEKKKKSANKGRAKELEAKVKQCDEQRQILDEHINSWFKAVFLHRYRDVDPRIRVDCVRALGGWIATYPDFFFEEQYLRYFGWVLSDLHAPTRLEVITELQSLYHNGDRLAGLKTFTERFRARMVEMATRDVDPNVRAASVDLLGSLREAQLLEPDDIDSVGKLIFDSEPRVRSSVVAFFVESIKELVDAKKEEMGGEEVLEDAAGGEDDENYNNPRIEWLTLKSLVELLQAYSADEDDLPSNVERWHGGTEYALVASGVESKFSVAAQSLYDSVEELRNWQVLAGYVLYDHSRPVRNGAATDAEGLLRTYSQLNESEEVVLLELLNAAVKMHLAENAEAATKTKLTKKERDEVAQKQEDAARHLASIIPQLLKKFGAQPESAAAVLRLEHVLNLEVFEELRQDHTTYAALLDDIKKQFLTHADEIVLAEASAALLHARRFDTLEEVTEGKVQELWDGTMDSLHKITQGKDMTVRGGLSNSVLTSLTSIVLRISNLAQITNCIERYEAVPSSSSNRKGKSTARTSSANNAQSSAMTILINLLRRGPLTNDTTPETDALEDALVANAIRAGFFYFVWKINGLREKIAADAPITVAELEVIAQAEDDYIRGVTRILTKRRGADDLRIVAAGCLIDLHCALVSLRHARAKDQPATQQDDDWTSLISEIAADTQATLRELLGAAERVYARKSGKRLEVTVDNDEDPLSDDEADEEPEDDDAAEDEENAARTEETMRAALLAEQRLCELAGKIVLGILAGVIDGKDVPRGSSGGQGPMRRRLERNKARLGQNFKQVVEYIDIEKKNNAKAARAARAKDEKRKAAGQRGKGVKSKEIIDVEDDEDDEDEDMGDRELLGNEDPEDPIEDADDAVANEDGQELDLVSLLGE